MRARCSYLSKLKKSTLAVTAELCRSLRALIPKSCGTQVMSHMDSALQPALPASNGLLSGVAAGHELPVLTGIVELFAAIEALQVGMSTKNWRSMLRQAMRASNDAAFQEDSGC